MKWTLQKRKIKDLREYAKNPRRLLKKDANQLKESLDKFGQCEPIVINTDNTIIGGHQRVRTLKKLNYKEVDVYVPDRILNEKETEELNIRLNKNVGDWDFDVLANAWDVDDLFNWGFTVDELQIDKDEEKGSESKSLEKPCQLHITFEKPEDLQEAEMRIMLIVDEYPGAYSKCKI